jgi:hypothetical protein
MTKLLLVAHGMGSNPPGWSDDIRKKLDEVASRYASFSGGASAFSQRVKLCEIRYDAVFDQHVEQWRASAASLEAWSSERGRPLPRIAAWLRTTLPGDEAAKNFFWSTAVDPLLYRGFELVRDQVRAVVMAQTVGYLTQNMVGGAADACVLSHSLGTAVMHDTLAKLGAEPQAGTEVLMAKNWKFRAMLTLANVCTLGPRALRDLDPYASCVRPVGRGEAAQSYCHFFLNAWHEWDPFVRAGRFDPDANVSPKWGSGYIPVGPLRHVKHANVHGFRHYLDHPAVHVPLINAALGTQTISQRELQDALARYPTVGSEECDAQLATLRAKAAEVAAANDDLEELVIRIAEFHATAKRAAQECRALGDDGAV